MKTFIIAAMSADGFIAEKLDQPSTAWTSQADKKNFVALTQQAGTMIMGETTYETIGRALPGRRLIVYSAKTYPGIETTTEAPADLLARLEREGASTVAICGGATIYTLFLEQNLVDKIFLTIEGVIFGQGLNLFRQPLARKLSLLNVTKIGDNTVLLEYQVNK